MRKLWFGGVVIALLFTAFRLKAGFGYALGIDQHSITVGQVKVERRDKGLSDDKIVEIIPSPVAPRSCLARSEEGRVWRTSDLGAHWDPVEVSGVAFAAYSPDGSLFIARDDLTVALEGKSGFADISPPASLVKQAQADRRSKPENFTVRAIGVSNGGEIWVVTAGLPVYDPLRALRDGYLGRLEPSQSLNLNHDLALLVRDTDAKWRLQSTDRLSELEGLSRTDCRWSVGAHYDLRLNDKVVPTDWFGVTMRAGPLRGGTYFAMGDGALQVGEVADCELRGLNKVWEFDGLVGTNASEPFEGPDGIEILTPTFNGLKAVTIPETSFPAWKLVLHWVYFQNGLAMIWGLVVAVGLLLYFRHRG